jgi:hypothetical protein
MVVEGVIFESHPPNSRDSDTTQNVTQAAKEAGLWNQRKSKKDDKIMDRKGYFKASFPRRDTKTKRSRKPHTELCGGDRPKKKTNTKRSQSRDKKLSSPTEPARVKADTTKPVVTQEAAPDVELGGNQSAEIGAEGDAKKKTNKGQVPATIALDDDKDFLPGFHCYICGSSFEGKDEVDTHIRDYHDPQPEEPKDGENSIKNWLEEQDNPRFKPTLNLRKVDRNFPNLGNQLEKLKADREERESKTNKENKSAASSVEFVDEVIHITGQPVTQEPGTEENDRSGSPLTPLARGWVPLYTGTETPQASGEEPTSGEEPPKDGEMSPSKDSSPRQQTVTLESGECTPSSDDPQSDQSYVIEFPSDYEGRDCVQNLPRQQTAAM